MYRVAAHKGAFPSEYFIFFLSLALVEPPAFATDVDSAYVGKGRVYAQTNAGLPSIKPGAAYIFDVAVRMTQSNAVTSARYAQPPFPAGTGNFIPPASQTPLLLSWIERSFSQTALDNAHMNGDYYFVMETAHDRSKTNHVQLLNPFYPNAPRVLNYDAAQAIDPAADFTLQWANFAFGGQDDLITFTIMEAATNGRPDIVYQTTPLPGAPQALDGTQTSATIPAGTLVPGRVYLGRLRFDNIVSVDRTNYPSEVGLAAYFVATDFPIATIGADSNTAPKVIALYPPDGAVDVPTDAPVIWTFNKPMQRSSFLSSTYVTDRTFFWTTDRRSFVILPLIGHSTNVTITYQLQPWAPALGFGDPLGNPLFTDVANEFQTADKRLPPPTQPRLGVPTIGTNTVEMLLHGESNRIYAVQFSTNLSNWTAFSTNVTVSGPSLVTHPAPSPQRFYRALVLH